MSDPAAVEVVGLTVRYGDTVALDDVNLAVPMGVTCALIGTNGSGKSTLMKAIVGAVPADVGHVRINGATRQDALRLGLVGYVPQAESVDWDFPLSVHDLVLTGRYHRMGVLRRPSAVDRDRCEQALVRTGMAELRTRQIGNLSGGQRKRAFVARALAQGASLLLLDEPFAGVDQASALQIVEVLQEIARTGTTVMVSTHDIGRLRDLADEVILLKTRVLAHGGVDEILRADLLAPAFEASDWRTGSGHGSC